MNSSSKALSKPPVTIPDSPHPGSCPLP
jgi:hypothetical protein